MVAEGLQKTCIHVDGSCAPEQKSEKGNDNRHMGALELPRPKSLTNCQSSTASLLCNWPTANWKKNMAPDQTPFSEVGSVGLEQARS